MASSFSSNSMCLSLGEQSSKIFILSKPSSFFAKPCRNNKNFHVSCSNDNANKNNGDDHEKNVARRNVLVGLGGLYGASNLAPLAYASPIPIPNLKSCGNATKEAGIEVDYSCCPPTPAEWNNIPYYKFPPMSKLRRRPRAQQVTEEYIAKYQLATQRMMDLNEKDPRSFKQQANIHCAYCNGAYKFGDDVLQVHFNWLFFPFHRWYLYFYERILGKLIDDPTFALPYWNWDHPDGMRLPPMFDRRNTSLYDPRRNPHVRNGTIIDFRYGGDEEVSTDVEQTVTNNLTSVYRSMITNAACPLQFFGARYLLGTNNNKDAGTIETMPHTPIHIWTGTVRGTTLEDGKTSFGEDMGNFYSAGLDPVFYSHHANVDRMWNIWKGLGGKKRDIKEENWLNSEFFFYDENEKPYRVRVGDCLDTRKMGYDYAPADIPWINCRPTRKGREGKVDSTKFDLENKVFPITNLNKPISFCIKRPKTSRSQEDKIEKEEVLIFKGLKYDSSKYVRFDVFLNEDENVNADELDKVEFAGTYVNLPHNHAHNNNKKMDNGETFQLDITECLEDCGLEDDDIITVTVVPTKGGGAISIQSVAIEFLES